MLAARDINSDEFSRLFGTSRGRADNGQRWARISLQAWVYDQARLRAYVQRVYGTDVSIIPLAELSMAGCLANWQHVPYCAAPVIDDFVLHAGEQPADPVGLSLVATLAVSDMPAFVGCAAARHEEWYGKPIERDGSGRIDPATAVYGLLVQMNHIPSAETEGVAFSPGHVSISVYLDSDTASPDPDSTPLIAGDLPE